MLFYLSLRSGFLGFRIREEISFVNPSCEPETLSPGSGFTACATRLFQGLGLRVRIQGALGVQDFFHQQSTSRQALQAAKIRPLEDQGVDLKIH